MNKLKKILAAAMFFMMAFSLSSFSQVVGDYGSIQSGNWGDPLTWQLWDGAGFNTPAGAEPSSTDNVFITGGFTVTVEVNSKNCTNLTVEAGNILYANSGGANRYINVLGNIVCDGQIGNGSTFDCLSFNINGANVSISGASTGTFDASVIRKETTTNLTTALAINRNVNLRNAGAAVTNIYNDAAGTATKFNVTVAANDTLALIGTATGGAAIDGPGGSSASEASGTFTINGVMDVQGILYLTTNNNTAGDSCKWIVNGELKSYQVNAPASINANAKHIIYVNSGGKWNLTGTPGFFTLSTVNNSYIFNNGSTVEYSAIGAQTVINSVSFGAAALNQYYNLILSGDGNKTLAGLTSIRNDITITNATGSPVLVAGSQNVNIGGNWTNYNQTGFTKTGNQIVTFNGGTGTLAANTQTITCPGGELFRNLTLNKGGVANTWFLRLNNDVDVDSVVLFSNTPDRAALDLNGHKLTLRKTSTGALVGIFDAANSRYIVSETAVGSANYASNPSIIQWNMGTAAAGYVFPFGYNGSYLPVTIGKKATAFIDSVQVSTRRTLGSDNLPWDTTTNVPLVANMNSVTGANNSDTGVVDRWWDIIPSQSLPYDSLKFTYRGAENSMIAPYNTGEVYPQNWGLLDPSPTYQWFGHNCTDKNGVASACAMGVTVGTSTVVTYKDTLKYGPWVLSSRSHPLPISLLEFTAALHDNKVETKWTTATEVNNRYFSVERSGDAKLFDEVGRVSGAGNSSEAHYYGFTDLSPLKGISYYRLRQTDFDGHFTYSDVVSIFNKDKNHTWYIFPNPATDKIQLANTGDDMPDAVLQLFNPEGALVKSMSLGGNDQALITIDIKDFSNGIYIGKISDAYHQEIFKIVKN